MGQVKSLSTHRPLPARLISYIEDGAWGMLGQALEDGVSPNLKGADEKSLFGAVVFALSYQGEDNQTSAAPGPLSLLNTFLARGLEQEVSEGVGTVVSAAASGQWHWVKRLIEAGHQINIPGGRPILFSVLEGRMARRLRNIEDQDLTEGMSTISQMHFHADTPEEIKDLHDAVGLLVASGADIEALDEDEEAVCPTTPLMLSVMYGDLPMANALLCAGASLHGPWGDEADEKFKTQMHPIALSSKEGCTDILDLLMGCAGLDIQGVYGADAMHLAATKGHLSCLKVLGRHGIAYDVPSRSGGFRPLHQAALHGHKSVIDWFLDAGDNWETQSDDGISPGAVLSKYHPELARSYGLSTSENVIPLRPR